MEKEFVPYIQALELKKLGFNEPCLGGYIRFRGSETFELAFYKYRNVDFNATSNIYVSAPIFSQVFRWFREKYNVYAIILPSYADDKVVKNRFFYEIADGNKLKQELEYHSSYEEAELACLEKLIEIVKTK